MQPIGVVQRQVQIDPAKLLTSFAISDHTNPFEEPASLQPKANVLLQSVFLAGMNIAWMRASIRLSKQQRLYRA